MKIFNTKETWLVALTDEEVVAITAQLLHNKANNIKATKEEKLKALNYFENRLLKEKILEREIQRVKEYEQTYSNSESSQEKRVFSN